VAGWARSNSTGPPGGRNPALRTLVSRYVGYRQHGVTLPVHYGLPSGHVTFVVSLEQPVRVIGMPGGAGRGIGRWQAVAPGCTQARP